MAAAVAAALGAPAAVHAGGFTAGTQTPPPLVVSTCADAGPGSLRDAVAQAPSGATVDLRKLACAAITLETGAIRIDADDLTVLGPGAGRLVVDAGSARRVFEHAGTGVLRIADLALAHGRASEADGGCLSTRGSLALDRSSVSSCELRGGLGADVRGGCIAAAGDVALRASSVSGCLVVADRDHAVAAFGAGLHVGGDLTMVASTIGDSRFAVAPYAFTATSGGGARVEGDFSAYESAISGNSAAALERNQGRGGGLEVMGTATIVGSTISGNSAQYGGGALLRGGTLVNSTISGNAAAFQTGGLVVEAPFSLQGSTIAFNSEPQVYGAGLFIRRGAVEAVSTIIAANASGGSFHADVGGDRGADASLEGRSNLIEGWTPLLPVPDDTLVADPRLLPLADNGGPTRTHALAADSPAIDAGDGGAEAFDQRGSPYRRVFGRAADIGAYERPPAPQFGRRSSLP